MDAMRPNELRLAPSPLVSEGVFVTIEHSLQHPDDRVDGGTDVRVVTFERLDLADSRPLHSEEKTSLMVSKAGYAQNTGAPFGTPPFVGGGKGPESALKHVQRLQ